MFMYLEICMYIYICNKKLMKNHKFEKGLQVEKGRDTISKNKRKILKIFFIKNAKMIMPKEILK